MFEKSVHIDSNGTKLSATLCLPKETGEFPMVIYIQGSGDTDRDDNPPSAKNKTPKSSVEFFNDLGFGSIRYDKRGVADSEGDFYTAGHSDLVSDAECVLQFLYNSENCDIKKIFIVGHSEGTLIASRIVVTHNYVAGIILLCPVYTNLEDTLFKQAANIKTMSKNQGGIGGLILRAIFWLYDPVKGQRKFNLRIRSSTDDVIRYMFLKTPAKWFREILDIEPRDIYKQVQCPALVIGGSKDTQCDPNDIKLIEQTIPGPVECHVIKDLTHVLRKETGNVTFFTHSKLLKLPIDAELRETIRKWILTLCS